MNKIPFMYIPPNYDPQTYMLFNRMSIYIKTLESKLMQAGILSLGEVERGAKQAEALQAIEGIEGQLQAVQANIDSIDDPGQKHAATVQWGLSPEKAALEHALNEYKTQLADTFVD